jgi:signal transduction histidine kinase
LKLSRLGRTELNPELVKPEQIVHSLLKTLAHQVESRQTQVRVHPLPDLVIDRTAIERIFGNLLDNALKYLEPSRPGSIEISAEQNPEEVTFTIRDNGRGIAPDDIKKVFDPFRRLGKQDVPGEGMGLSYVKTLVKRLSGRIWCESELGVGTRFSFTVPAKPIAPAENGPSR